MNKITSGSRFDMNTIPQALISFPLCGHVDERERHLLTVVLIASTAPADGGFCRGWAGQIHRGLKLHEGMLLPGMPQEGLKLAVSFPYVQLICFPLTSVAFPKVDHQPVRLNCRYTCAQAIKYAPMILAGRACSCHGRCQDHAVGTASGGKRRLCAAIASRVSRLFSNLFELVTHLSCQL